MKLLWISNVLFPEMCKELQLPVPVVGGWMEAGARSLLKINKEQIVLAVAMIYNGKELKYINKYSIKYYLIPSITGNLEANFKEIKDGFQPDLVHIHGTEYPHSLAYINACGTQNVVVSIQGLVSVYAQHYFGGICEKHIHNSFRDWVRQDSLTRQQRNMAIRGVQEIALLQKIEHVIGRTSWDQSHIWAINSSAFYHFCNETLRPAFYEFVWEYNACEPFSIFLSQAHYPIKGIHQIIKAVSIVKRHFPEVKVYVAGNNFFNISLWKRNGFANYIQWLMKKSNLLSNFIFLGPLPEKEMALRFQKANVFVCPSAIENSPNSVGEAQLIGTPCIASYVGGSMDMIKDGETGFLYRFEEIELLAYRICQLFREKELCIYLSENEKAAARKRHDGAINAEQLFSIYKKIIAS